MGGSFLVQRPGSVKPSPYKCKLATEKVDGPMSCSGHDTRDADVVSFF